jgi:hypothetical protein
MNRTRCIVNAFTGDGWYPLGQKRLAESLAAVGSTADLVLYSEEWPSPGYDRSCPYNLKASALKAVVDMGYTRIMWLDCSVWAVQDPAPMWDIVESEGYYLGYSGHNAAQTCSDKILEYFGVTRDQAETIPDVSSGIFGMRMDHPLGSGFMTRFFQAAKDRAFAGSREHGGQSQDPRFLFHRQDQAAASLIAGTSGMHLHAAPDAHTAPGPHTARLKCAPLLTSYYSPPHAASVIFLLQGI